MKLASAQKVAERIAAELTPFCDRLEVAGSIRRRRPEVGDIDLVCLPKGLQGREAILARCAEAPTARKVKEGAQYVVFEYTTPGDWTLQLDLWFAHAGTNDLFNPEPSNWGMLLLARTGSAMFNVWLASRAIAQGKHFNPHRGILKRGAVIASEEEAEIFNWLNLDFIPPEERER